MIRYQLLFSVLVGCLTIYSLTASAAAVDRQRVIVLVGAAGTDEYRSTFADWTDQWKSAAESGEADLLVVGQDESASDLELLQQHVAEAVAVKTAEPLWLVLIGHGTYDGREARFNLRGKDLSASAAAKLLNGSQRPVAVINCTSCSAPFINALSGDNRIVITGTKDGNEIQFTRFGGYIAEAVGKLDADIDRDGQTSLLEAWLYAARRTEEYYESDGRLATEHSLLDDTGDGKGTRFESFEGVRLKKNIKNRDSLDGKLARRWHLVRSEAEKSLTPEQRATRDELEENLEILRERREELSENDYLRQLEKILLPLAKLYEEADTAQAQSTQGKAPTP